MAVIIRREVYAKSYERDHVLVRYYFLGFAVYERSSFKVAPQLVSDALEENLLRKKVIFGKEPPPKESDSADTEGATSDAQTTEST